MKSSEPLVPGPKQPVSLIFSPESETQIELFQSIAVGEFQSGLAVVILLSSFKMRCIVPRRTPH